jgi:pimeloyl-ACP methyl ester carboxylesterase
VSTPLVTGVLISGRKARMMATKIPHNDPATAQVHGLEIVYDTFGDPTATPMLLIMGLGCQMIHWDEPLCVELASNGYWVIRYDNRDIGLSTKFDDAGTVNIPELFAEVVAGGGRETPYSLRDMADDAKGLLDTLEIKAAHIVGVSMGGMIAQLLAIHYPERLLTLTSIMSSTGEPDLPNPDLEAMGVLLEPTPLEREGYIEQSLAGWRVFSGSKYPLDEERLRLRAGRIFDRGLCPEGADRQLAAVLTSEGRKKALKSVEIPTLVIHGDADPLVPVEGGIETANAIPGAELLLIEGMGHSLPEAVWPQIVRAVVKHAS